MTQNNSLKLFSTDLHNIKLLLFFMYNLTYVLYMSGYIGRSINLILLFAFIMLCIIEYMLKNDWVLGEKGDFFWPEFRKAMFIVIAFIVISTIIQLFHGDIKGYLYTELLFNIIPPVLAFFWINTTYSYERYTYFVLIFLRNFGYFLIANISNFTINNILRISLNDSGSSIFEIPYAHDFLFSEIIFLYFGKRKMAFLSMILCMLCFKRISFVLSIAIFVSYILITNTGLLKKFFINWISVKRGIRNIILICMCISPFIIKWIVSDAGMNFFQTKLDLNLNKFTSGRVGIINHITANIGSFNGYGSSDYFLTTNKIADFRKIGSMHCDILKLYFETTLLGVFIYVYEMLEIAKKNWIIFLMLMYIFMELICSHFLDALGVWNMFFMFTAMVYAERQNEQQLRINAS